MNSMRTRSLIVSLLIIAVTACGGKASIATPAPSSSPGAPSPTLASPRVVSAAGSEAALTVTYDGPMKHGLACGTQGFVAGPANTIDALEMNIATRYYTSPDADFDEVLSAMWVASLNADCSAVTFTFVHGIAPGTYPLRITKVQDQAGRPLASDPITVIATMLETAAPRMQLVQQWEDHAVFQFSEPIKEGARRRRRALPVRRSRVAARIGRRLSDHELRGRGDHVTRAAFSPAQDGHRRGPRGSSGQTVRGRDRNARHRPHAGTVKT
jgi:hypothetical protein